MRTEVVCGRPRGQLVFPRGALGGCPQVQTLSVSASPPRIVFKCYVLFLFKKFTERFQLVCKPDAH